jgi:hypothetical protein
VHDKERLNIRVTSRTVSKRRRTVIRRVSSPHKGKVCNQIWLIDGGPVLNPVSKTLKTNFSKMNKISPANTN